MKLEYLNEFLVLSRIRNYVVAADMLYISQASLTRHIKALEEFYGVTLFERSTRKMEITKEGQLLVHYAESILRLYNGYLRETGLRAETNNYLDFAEDYLQ